MIRVAPNQKAIRIHKCSISNTRFTTFTYESMLYAMKKLSPSAFKVWVWLCSNKEGYELALSGAILQEDCDFSSATYTKSVRELINKGFLTPAELRRNFQGYIFWEGGAAQQEREQIPLTEEDEERIIRAFDSLKTSE